MRSGASSVQRFDIELLYVEFCFSISSLIIMIIDVSSETQGASIFFARLRVLLEKVREVRRRPHAQLPAGLARELASPAKSLGHN